MDTKSQIGEILSTAATSLTMLMRSAIEDSRFGDVAMIATVADTLAKLESDLISSPSRLTPEQNGTMARQDHTRTPETQKRQPTKYPVFERDGDKVVKIGWSKKNRSTYEHRTPFTTVIDLLEKLDSVGKLTRLFTVDDLIPLIDKSSREEVPAYQVYLALAWLRSVGIVSKKGRDGYTVSRANPLRAIQDFWSKMEEKK